MFDVARPMLALKQYDVGVSPPAHLRKVAEAFTVLSDETKRAKYDNSGDMDLEGHGCQGLQC